MKATASIHPPRGARRRFPPGRLLALLALLACLGGAMAQEVIVSVGQRDFTDDDLKRLINSSTLAVAFPTFSKDQAAGVRGELLKRVIASELLYHEAKRLGLDKTPEYRNEMKRFEQTLLYQRYLDRLRNQIEVPKEVQERIQSQFKDRPADQLAARDIYIGKRFPELKAKRLQELRKRYHLTLDEKALRAPHCAGDTVLAKGDGIRITYNDIGGARKPNLAEAMLRLQRASEAAVFARAARDEGIDIRGPLDDYSHSLLSRMLLARKQKEWVPDQKTLRAWLVRHPEIAYAPAKWHLGEIVLKNAEQAVALRDTIRNGASLFELAGQYSIDPVGRANYGDIGWVTEGAIDPKIEQALRKLRPGEVSEVIRTPRGYVLVTVIDARPRVKKPFSAVADQARRALTNQRLARYLSKLQERYPLRWRIPVYIRSYEDFFNMQ